MSYGLYIYKINLILKSKNRDNSSYSIVIQLEKYDEIKKFAI